MTNLKFDEMHDTMYADIDFQLYVVAGNETIGFLVCEENEQWSAACMFGEPVYASSYDQLVNKIESICKKDGLIAIWPN